MIFNSLSFLIFFPVVVLGYFALPKKCKNFWLLAASYYFYMNWNARYGLLLLLCTVVTYGASRLLERASRQSERGKRRGILAAALLIIFGLLFYFKYVNFAIGTLQAVLGRVGVSLALPTFDIVLPVGISFFTFQAAGYLIDVYRGDIYAEKNFFRYALFVSFFPQLVAGPIERSKNLLKQLDRTYRFEFARAREGLYLMLWGYVMKMIVADRAAILVDNVFNNYQDKPGSAIVLATFLFAFQIYGDFGGYSLIAIGAARILGIRLMQNFNSPYYANSSADFWRRWHISLNTWFRDYLYIPLGGNRHGRFRKNLNLLIVFLVSGLWHGARWNFVVWGGINGLYQIVGSLTKGLRQKFFRAVGIRTESFSHRAIQILMTFVLTDLSWMFFRVNSMRDAAGILSRIAHEFHATALIGQAHYNWGLAAPDFLVLKIAIIVILLMDWVRYCGYPIKQWFFKQGWWFRTLVFVTLVLSILLFGIWGNSYDAQSFIYFQF